MILTARQNRFSWLTTIALAVGLTLSAHFAAAQAPQPLVSCAFPAGGQRGRTFEVTVSGTNLQGATAARISGPGVTAKVLDGAKPDATRISVSISLNAELGVRDLRIVTPGGISSRYRFMIGDLPEINEVEPNSEFAQAQRLPALPVRVNGRIDDGDRDYFRFSARAGQTIVFALQGRTLLPYIPDAVPGWLDACLTLFDADGNELAMNDDFFLRPDPVLIYNVAKDGDYVLEVRDMLFRGRPTFIYRLSVGMTPYLTHAFPLGGQRGTSVPVELHGVNLPMAIRDLTIPTDSPPLRQIGQEGASPAVNILPFAVGTLPEVYEAEPNDTLAQANRVDVPCAVNGRIQRRGDSDYFIFTAQAGQTLAMEVQARRLGSPLDSMLYLLNAQGGELARNDDWTDPADELLTHHADSRIVYTFPAAGDYVLRIKDIQQNSGDEYTYRLLLRPPQPDFIVRVSPDNPRLGKGDTAVLSIKTVRLDGLGGDIELAPQNLPPGLIVSPAVVLAGQDQARMTVTATKDAPPGIAVLNLNGTAVVGKDTIVHAVAPTEDIMQAFSLHHDLSTKELVAAVLEPTLLTLSTNLAPTAISEIRPATEFQVVVKAMRLGGAKGPVTVALDGPPGWLSLKAPVTIPPEKDEAAVLLTITKDAPVGQRVNLFLTGTLNTGKETATRFAPAVAVKVVPAPPPPAPAPAPPPGPAGKPPK